MHTQIAHCCHLPLLIPMKYKHHKSNFMKKTALYILCFSTLCFLGYMMNTLCSVNPEPDIILEKMESIKLDKPNFDGMYKASSKKNEINLEFRSKSPNDITDDEEWLNKYSSGMSPKVTYTFTPGGVHAPQEIKKIVPTKYYGLYRRYIEMMDGYNVIYYGKKYSSGDFGVSPELIVVTDSSINKVIHAFDFLNFSHPQDSYNSFAEFYVSEVQIENDVLYACWSHDTYSKFSNGYNAYLLAIDLKTSTLKWMTKPLTCNSGFQIYKDVILTGYGFTDEKDYVYVIDKETGDRILTRAVDKAPGYFSVIEDKLYVRTYSLDYTFQIIE